MKKVRFLFLLVLLVLILHDSRSQSVPMGFQSYEENFRRSQLLGDSVLSLSLNMRPIDLHAVDLTHKNIGAYLQANHAWSTKNQKLKLEVLPFQLIGQYNSRNPHGWNDGLMIPSAGLQTLASGGITLKAGVFGVQLRPEAVWAQNRAYEGFSNIYVLPTYNRYIYNYIDNPERFGGEPYVKLHPGQSSAGFYLGPVFLGVSSQNIWWGPGKRNSLLFSNNAPGFYHATVKTLKPVRTPLGSFESQILVGKLVGSGYEPTQVASSTPGLARPNDWRYLSGFTVNYSPSWLGGFHIGASRVFQQYFEDTRANSNYFPGLMNVFRSKDVISDDVLKRDQLISLYFRWLWKRANAELYGEYGRNDASWNLRDFIMTPEHSRAYILGFSKLIATNRDNAYFQLNAEITQLQQTANYVIRDAKSWYIHSQVRHGYTHFGQVLGAGIGPGGNLQSIEVSYVHELNKIGLQLERLLHNGDFYMVAYGYNPRYFPWVDTSAGVLFDRQVGHILLSSKLSLVHSMNYQWSLRQGSDNARLPAGRNSINVFFNVGVVYGFNKETK